MSGEKSNVGDASSNNTRSSIITTSGSGSFRGYPSDGIAHIQCTGMSFNLSDYSIDYTKVILLIGEVTIKFSGNNLSYVNALYYRFLGTTYPTGSTGDPLIIPDGYSATYNLTYYRGSVASNLIPNVYLTADCLVDYFNLSANASYNMIILYNE